ncbi:MAG: UDP-N-acetylmuramate--L-alanine ligase [Helicobacteraceae bacterium]|nr:UDP-N-acetylmuramate--L-alanine ligase [Helicobacteraceae bacterium]
MKLKIHFVGIGGIGISALARLAAHEGHEVSGSDIAETPLVAKLRAEKIAINIPHNADAVADANLVIHSAIIKPDNCEILAARSRGIEVLHRREALARLLADKEVFAVAGAHGKSTTTAILAAILECSALIGAEAKSFGSNVRFVEGKTLVFEADESDASFLCCNPSLAIVTNAEPEHLEYYGYDLARFYGAYEKFLSLCETRILNAEDEFLARYAGDAARLKPSADITNLRYELIGGEPHTTFALQGRGEFSVWGFGEHIAIDAALAILAAEQKLPLETIRAKIGGYKGIKKRFDILKRGENLAIIDDYGHHPTEIEATLKSAREYKRLAGLSKVAAIWQPHKFSRVIHNLDRFVECFNGVDELAILPVWAAGEEYVEIDFAGKFARYKPVLARNLEEFANCRDLTRGLIIGFGAGDLTYQLRSLVAASSS